jgi:hypothetical protein
MANARMFHWSLPSGLEPGHLQKNSSTFQTSIPRCADERRSGILTRLAPIAVTLGITVFLAAQDFPRHWDDSPVYIGMAQGLPALMPWAGRILLPDLVALLTKTLGLEMDQAFELINCLAFTLWLLIVSERWRASIWLPFFLVLPLAVAGLQNVYITDMFHMGLTAIFIVLLRYNPVAAAGFMVFMMLGRENSMLLALISAGLLLWNRKIFLAAAMLAAYLIGSVIAHSAASGASNVHKMPEILYLFLKMPSNFLQNWLGVQLWTNGYAWCEQPVFTISFPGTFHLGVITKVGFCAPSIVTPLAMAASYVTIFGVLPAVLVSVLKSRGVPVGRWREEWWATAFAYGALMFFLATLVGNPVDRDIAFAWPLFLIALPTICSEMLTWKVAALNISAAWGPLLLSSFFGPLGGERLFTSVSMAPLVSSASLAIGIAANVATYRLMRLALVSSNEPALRSDLATAREV